MFCFLSSGVPVLTWAYLKGFGEGKNKYNWLFKTKWIFPFRLFRNCFRQALAVLPSWARALFDCVALCSLLPSSTLLASGRRGRCSLCRSETLCQRAAGNTFSMQSQRSGLLLVSFFFLDVAKLLLSVLTIIPEVAHCVWLFFSFAATEHSVRSVCCHNHKLTLPLFFLSSPCAVSLLSPPSFCKEWYKFTKKNWPDRKGHNWLPVQCAKASCSVTLNNFSKSKNNNNLSLLRLMLLCIVAPARPYLYIVPYKRFCTWCKSTNMLPSCPTHMKDFNITFRLCLGVVATLAIVRSSQMNQFLTFRVVFRLSRF